LLLQKEVEKEVQEGEHDVVCLSAEVADVERSLMSVFNALQHFLVVSICFAFCSGSIHCTVHYTVAWVLLICNLLLQF